MLDKYNTNAPEKARKTEGGNIVFEQAPRWSSNEAQQKFGAKRRASGACTHFPEYPMSASKFGRKAGIGGCYLFMT